MSAHERNGVGRVPAVVLDVEVLDELPSVPAHDPEGRRREQAWLVVRVATEPVGLCVIDMTDDGLSPYSIATEIQDQLGDEVGSRLRRLALGARVLPEASPPVVPSPFVAGREEAMRTSASITAVVCTRDQPEGLRRCLSSLLGQDHPRFQVLVVDNAPSSDASLEVVRELTGGESDQRLHYIVEPRPGLSRARNAALAYTNTELIAFLDDDETADEHWLAELTRGFLVAPHVDAVAGVVVPAELETVAQAWFEQFGGHSKGRGFRHAVFGPETVTIQQALYPLPPFGTGANMAFRRSSLVATGGFDVALGAGTLTHGGEDTRIFTQILLNGGTVAYRPSALTRHFHRRSIEDLQRQLHGYGVGLTAFYTSLLTERPRLAWPLLRLAPRALLEVFGNKGLRSSTIREDFPKELLSLNVRGLMVGPLRYAQARWRARGSIPAP